MKLKSKFVLSIGVLYLVLIILAAFLWRYDKILFIISEVLILISVIITINLYNSYVKPLDIFSAGIESIKQKDFSVTFTKSGHYEVDLIIDLYNQMIEKLREERIQLQEHHYFLEKLIEASPSSIIVLNYENRIQSYNPAALKILTEGKIELRGKTLQEVPGRLAGELSNIDSGESKTVSVDGIHTYKVHKAHFIERGFQHHFIVIEELTNEILRTEKKAYEKVIRMMSHEVNNTVGAINSIMSSLLTFSDQLNQEDREDYENSMKVSIDRNTRMSSFMSKFAGVVRLPEPHKSLKDVHTLLNNVSDLLKGWCQERNIELIKDFSGEWFVQMDESQMEQVLINVCKNAIESIEKNGTLTILTIPEKQLLIIRDTGKGIIKEVAQKLFSPFFSNKTEGQGIGLTLTKEILINHGFAFSLETKKEGWTDFEIRFK